MKILIPHIFTTLLFTSLSRWLPRSEQSCEVLKLSLDCCCVMVCTKP